MPAAREHHAQAALTRRRGGGDLLDLLPDELPVEREAHDVRRPLHAVQVRLERSCAVAVQAQALEDPVAAHDGIVKGDQGHLSFGNKDAVDHHTGITHARIVPDRREIRVAGACMPRKRGGFGESRGQGTHVPRAPGHSARVAVTMAPKPFALLAGIAAIACIPAAPALAQQTPAPSSPAPDAGAVQSPAPAVPQPPVPQAPAPAAPVPAAPTTPPATATQQLRPGARGAAVKSLQRALRKRGIAVPVDGAYGSRTRAGVRILQRRMKVRPTGIADARVLRRLGITVRAVASAPAGVRDSSGSFDGYPVPQPNDTTPSAAGFVWPTNGMVSSPFGPRWGRMHEGIDIAAPVGRPVRAAKAGVVATAEMSGAYGNLVVIDHGNAEQTRYAHLSAFEVPKGTPVAIGQVIGRIGSTGRSTGPHLHFEIRFAGVAANPIPYL
jgi:murein DD-endopeptidase MepM/ murein hydrolase activator NlpD